jgi:membrane protein
MSDKSTIIIRELPNGGNEYKKLLISLFKKSAKDFIQYSPVTILAILALALLIVISTIIHPVISILLSYIVGFKLIGYYSHKKTGLQFPYTMPMFYYFYQEMKIFILVTIAGLLIILPSAIISIYNGESAFGLTAVSIYLSNFGIMLGIIFLGKNIENIKQSIFLLAFDINFLMNSLGIQSASEASKIALISYKLNYFFYLNIAIYLMLNIFITLIAMLVCYFMNITFLVPTLLFSVMFIFNMYLLRNIHQEIYDFGQKEKQTENATSTVKKLDYALDM